MVSPDDKTKFLAELEEIPIPSVACKRVGISKASIYRWKKDDPEFRKAMEEAISRGRENINDLGEGKLISLMKDGNFRAIKYWLESNDKRYYQPRRAVRAPSRDIHTVNFRVIGGNGAEVSVDTKPPAKNAQTPASGATNTADSASDSGISEEDQEATETKPDISD